MAYKHHKIPEFNAQELKRFWQFVDRRSDFNACWDWLKKPQTNGYGVFRVQRDNRMFRAYAHRLSYFLHFGVDPADYIVRHRCDNPLCCNPHHLEIGTQLDNVRDMHRRGRAAVGDKHPWRLRPELVRRGDNHPFRQRPELIRRGSQRSHAKLNEQIVAELRNEYRTNPNLTYSQLAIRYGIHAASVGEAIRGKTWKHVPLPYKVDNNKRRACGSRNHMSRHPERSHFNGPKKPEWIVRGEKHGLAKLTVEHVKKIRKLYKGKNGQLSELGRMFGVSRRSILNVVQCRTWTHI